MLSMEDFADKVGNKFRLSIDEIDEVDESEERSELELIEVTAVGQPVKDRQQFSIVFEGPRRSVPGQRTYRLEHDDLGEIDLFLVPIFGDDEIVRCEAVFT